MRNIRLSVWIVAAAFAVAACGEDEPDNGGGGSGGSGSDTAAEMKACMDEEMAICALRESCSEFQLDKLYDSLAACQIRAVPACLSTFAAAGNSWTATTLEACATAYPGESCTDFYDGNPVAACVPAPGAKQIGDACGASAQCATTYCQIDSDAICGTCEPLPVVGDPCEVQADCGRDLACAVPSGETDGECAAFAGSGAQCLTGTQPCAAGFACVGDNVGSDLQGTCQLQGATVGAACDSSRKTTATCDGTSGFVCIPTSKTVTTGTCQMIELVAAGSACGNIGAAPITGFADCGAGGECIKATGSATGTCAAPAADGAACDSDPTIGPPCLTGAKCVSADGGTDGTCQTPAAATCTDTGDGDGD